jgi:protease YdgD
LALTAVLYGAAPALAAGPAIPLAAQGTPAPALSQALELHKVAVFGTDQRTRLPRELQGLRRSIGLVYNDRTRTVCTAFCVADEVIATASHCVFRTKGETPPPLDRFVFARPGTRLPSVRFAGAPARTTAQQIVAGTVGISTKPPIEAAQDWAFVKLQQPACKGHALAIEPLTPDEIAREAVADRVFQAAFHRDFGSWTMAYSGRCEAGRSVEGSDGAPPAKDFVDAVDLVLHTCDTGGASSGSPLLIETPDEPRVVAINVGTFVRSRVMLEDGVVVKRTPATPVANTAVGAAAFAHRLAPFRRASVLTSRTEIRDLQRRLAGINLLEGKPAGRFDERTRSAIQLYEAQVGLPPMGLPTRELLDRLRAAPAASRH